MDNPRGRKKSEYGRSWVTILVGVFVLLRLGSLSSCAEEPPHLVMISVMRLTWNGDASRMWIPFVYTPDEMGRRIWECMTEPVFAKSENSGEGVDVNLFSRSGIKITAKTIDKMNTDVTIDLMNLKVPEFVKMTKGQITSALVDCIFDVVNNAHKHKPNLRFINRDEDAEIVGKMENAYYHRNEGDALDADEAHKIAGIEVAKKAIREDAELRFGKITSETKLLDTSNKTGGRIIVRDLRLPGGSEHSYRCEYYSNGVLVSCDTWSENTEPGKVTAHWFDDGKCTISMMDDWLQIGFDRDGQPKWAFGRRID